MRWAKQVACVGEKTGFWWGNLKERDHLEDPGVRWKDKIKMDLKEVECGDMDWIDLAQVTCKCGNEPSVSVKCGEFLD
jgi:hypothetical protein